VSISPAWFRAKSSSFGSGSRALSRLLGGTIATVSCGSFRSTTLRAGQPVGNDESYGSGRGRKHGRSQSNYRPYRQVSLSVRWAKR
jgi:hypothetical protein